MLFQLRRQTLHHFLEDRRIVFGDVGGLEGIFHQIEQFVAFAAGLLLTTERRGLRKVVVDDLPVAVAPDGEIIAPVWAVRVMHEELLLPELIAAAGDRHENGPAVDRVPFGRLGPGQFEQSGEEVGYVGHLRQDLVGWNRETFLVGIIGIALGPGGDEGNAHAAFVMRTFFAPQWRRAGDIVLMAQRRIRAIVAEENHQRVFRHTEFLKMIEHVVERFVHTRNERGEGLGVFGFAGVRIMGGKARVGFKRRMDGVMGEVQEERLLALDDLGDVFLGLQGQGLGKKGFRAVILVQMRHGMVRAPRALAVIFLRVITARCPERRAAHVDVEPEIQRLRSFASVRSKVRFAYVDGLVAFRAQHARQRHVALLKAGPVPALRPVGSAIVTARVYPVSRPMARGVLPGHDRDARRRTHAHCIKLIKPNALLGQTLHSRRAVVIIQRVPFGFALSVCKKRHGGVHYTHVINQEDHDVGQLGRRKVGQAEDE